MATSEICSVAIRCFMAAGSYCKMLPIAIFPRIRTLRRLAALEFDGFYPGHLIWSEQRGRRHLDKAREYLDRLLLPPNIV